MALPPGFGGDPTDPEAMRRAIEEKAQKYLQDGQKLLADGKVIQAKTKFKAAIGIIGLEGPGAAAFTALKGIHDEGMREVMRAKGLYDEGKFVEALDVAEKTKSIYANLFSGLELPQTFPNVSRLCKRIIKAIDKNPKAQMEIQEHEATKKLKRVLSLEKQVREKPHKYYDLYKAYRTIAKRFPDCPTGKDCAEQAIKLRNDARIWKAIRRERTRRDIASSLSTIHTLEVNGLTDDAAKERAKLLKKYPGKTIEELTEMAKD
ncbi:MAG TPA: hypothetical protein P5081_08160 [Phycisphaerae bacterium]|nr:hypothetical protein [Phycisphaerae bacterium]